MNRQASSVTRLVAVALLVAIAAAGCARHNGTETAQPAGSTPAAQPSQVDQAGPTLAPTPTDSAAPSPSNDPGASDAPGATTPAATSAPAATTDPLDGMFSNIDNLLNGVNSSLSGGDAGPAGGE